MVQTVGPSALFCYVYSPKIRWGLEMSKAKSRLKGFNMIMYADGLVAFSRYDEQHVLRERRCFKVPTAVVDKYLMIMQHEWWWVKDMPLDILLDNRKPTYRNMFGLMNQPLIICDELKTMSELEDVNRKGMYARRMHVMMEFVTELLFNEGILIQLDSYAWNSQKITPLSEAEIQAHQRNLMEAEEQELLQAIDAVNL